MFDYALIHYGEIALKGLNRPLYEKKLVENIEKALANQDYATIKKLQGRILLELNERSDVSKIEDALKKVLGISWFAFCYMTEADKESIQRCVDRNITFTKNEKIKVSTNRADKNIPFTSIDLNRELGTHLINTYGVKVSLKEPEKEIYIEIADGKAYIFTKKIRGLCGLPVGVSGNVLHLLSGGIDSPVAAWLLMKRGCKVDFLHFHAFQMFNERWNAKVLDLVKVLNKYSFGSRIFFVPFYPFEVAALQAPIRYRLILFRRFMVRVAEKLASKYGIVALGSGENLAQVSSQTLENLAVIEHASSLPILRPLLTYDKNEIVNIAKQIGTFEISVRPYKDCCSLFIAKHPVTKAKLEDVEAIEADLSLKDAVDSSVEKAEIIEVKEHI
ncbi:MAG: tRNA uracil 4-sulfurtransferase ThiI [Nitrososphaerales archaeon]